MDAGRVRVLELAVDSTPFASPQARLLVALILLAGVARARRLVWGDTWFNLVLGRDIATSGLIHSNSLTEQGFGVGVIDQQWLAHLLHYWIETHFTLPGLALAASVLFALGSLGAARCALARGATPGRTLLIGAFCLATITPQTVVRAQTFAIPLLVLTLCWLARDARRVDARTWWLVPITALWANLHGSVLIAPVAGALLAAARWIDVARGRRPLDKAIAGRDLGLVVGLCAAALVSPYATELPAYYASTFGNPFFYSYISEWAPPVFTQEPEVYLLAVLVGTLVLSNLRTAPVFELLLCSCLVLGTLSSIRHALPLGLVTMAFAPSMADHALGGRLRFEVDVVLRKSVRVLLPVATLAFFVGVPLESARTLRNALPAAFTDRVAAGAGGKGRILADEAHADRLLWYHPELKGRVAHDARVETLPVTYLEALATTYNDPQTPRSRNWLRGYDVVVVDRHWRPELLDALERDRGWKRLAADAHATAFVRIGGDDGCDGRRSRSSGP